MLKIRVNEGGHNIEENVIERRYVNGINNLFDIYLAISDQVFIFDNSEGRHILIAEKSVGSDILIIEKDKFTKMKSYYDKRS